MDMCNRWQSLLVDYVDGHLNDRDRRAVDAHLANCPACRARLSDEGWLSDRLRRAANQLPIEQLLVWPPREAAPQPRTRGRQLLVGAGLVALVVIVLARLPFTTSNETSAPDQTETPVTPNEDQRFAEIEKAIEREASAAQLAMSAELLAIEPLAQQYAAETMRLVAEGFPDTTAGRDAARRAGTPARSTTESL